MRIVATKYDVLEARRADVNKTTEEALNCIDILSQPEVMIGNDNELNESLRADVFRCYLSLCNVLGVKIRIWRAKCKE